MKKLITMAIMVLAVAAAMAQAPEKFTYQAVVRNASNALVSNAPVGVRVSILQGNASGSTVYVETQTVTTNANGLLTLEIGGGTAQQGTFADIDWANGPFFLKTEIDPNGGSNYSITSSQQMMSVPYAMYAQEAGNGFSGDYNDLTNTPTIPTVPTNVSAFTNDAGYITGYTETDPQFNAWDKDYNDLINKPVIPTVPTNVSTFTNDAGYITMDSIPAIPTVPTNVSAFTNDAGYLTGYSETDPQFNAWDKDYNDLINKPVIPTVPTSVSSFTNDAGYLTSYTETDPQFNAWDKNYNDLTNKPIIPTVPSDVSAFTNDAGYLTSYTETDPNVPAWAKEATKPAYDYSEIDNTPTIPTVPTNVSAFTNDAGYLTDYTETDPNVPAWAMEATKPAYDYSEIANTPEIPTVPTNVSAFTNDAGYIIMDSIPTNVSAFANDAQYITSEAIPTVVSAFENDAQYVTESELQLTVNVINNTFDTLDNTIDSLRNRIEELEGNHTPPTVMTTGVSDVSYHTATLNGSVIYIGGAPVAARGFCYDTVLHPTVESSMVSCGSGGGVFSANLLNLPSSTTYYVRAYATNMWGTNYGEEKTFTTLTEYAPSLEISAATDIDFTAFTCSGDVTDSGTYSVTARGFCYATTPDPVMTGEHVHLGNGTGVFSTTLTGLEPETTYYVRAYAVNAVGVSYSSNMTATTLTPTVPTVTTDSVSSYNECFATVTSDGGAPVTQRGFCYDTLPNPTTESNVVFVGDGVGEFEATLSGLPIGKLYFVKAFATNAKGTTYGNQFDFYAGCDSKTVTDYDGNVYNTVLIGTQCWMKENLRTTHYADGWPLEHGLSQSSTDAYYYYSNNNVVNNAETYGLLYNWKAVMRDSESSNEIPSGVQGVCPTGWHVPSYAEWTKLTNYVSSQSRYVCGSNTGIAKALAATWGWAAALNSDGCAPRHNQSATNNATGFSAVAAGCYPSNSGYGAVNPGCRTVGSSAKFSSSTSLPSWEGPMMFEMEYEYDSFIGRSYPNNLYFGYSVRCLRD
ncbi:MAG: fibrobacter succinogenes major paralogous domain-containing protein [Bacteroidales bacterium]|nr:fibrobacter succinogenes major paralogous domain-containing protein [Bacteroidales bacterium]